MPSPREPISLGTFAKRIVVLLGLTAALVGLLYFIMLRILRPNQAPARTWIDDVVFADDAFGRRCGPEAESLVTIVHSPDKRAWLQEAARVYMARCKNTQIRLISEVDLAASQRLLDGTLAATAWSPSDSMFVADFVQRRAGGAALDIGGSLVRSPIVLLTWADRVAALEQLWPGFADDRRWLAWLACAGVSRESAAAEPGQPATWTALWTERFGDGLTPPTTPSAAELDAWQRVDYVHTVPARSSLGLLALLMMVDGYVDEAAGEGPDDGEGLEAAIERHAIELEAWLRRCEGGMADFDGPPRTLTQRMFQRGSLGFDGVVTYENLALEAIEQFEAGEPGTAEVRIIYPSHALIADHPMLFLEPDAGAGAAARRFFEFTQSPAMQRQAVELGLRPAQRDELLSAPSLANPFVRLRESGVELALDNHEPPRPGSYGLRALIDLWTDATGRF